MSNLKSSEKPRRQAAKAPEKGAAMTFSKANLLTFRRYAKRADLLAVLLSCDEQYTFEQVDLMISAFMKGQVN